MKRRKGTALVRNEERVLRQVLALRNSGQETVHGYGLKLELAKAEAARGDTGRPPGKEMAVSTLYRCLSRLEDRGLVASELETGPSSHQGPARRVFRLTEKGIEVALGLKAQ